ncbi:proline-rich protein 2-like [Pteropus medius]|uniref:proline-rich protein 2-like n=1 Tax=Pteropus vampyrus TaxID=132908 RepID=UPI00196B0671|nr:proline-rich protein 2-like [Pteropus giganteus]
MSHGGEEGDPGPRDRAAHDGAAAGRVRRAPGAPPRAGPRAHRAAAAAASALPHRVGASSAPAPAALKLSGGDAGWQWRRRRRRERGAGAAPGGGGPAAEGPRPSPPDAPRGDGDARIPPRGSLPPDPNPRARSADPHPGDSRSSDLARRTAVTSSAGPRAAGSRWMGRGPQGRTPRAPPGALSPELGPLLEGPPPSPTCWTPGRGPEVSESPGSCVSLEAFSALSTFRPPPPGDALPGPQRPEGKGQRSGQAPPPSQGLPMQIWFAGAGGSPPRSCPKTPIPLLQLTHLSGGPAPLWEGTDLGQCLLRKLSSSLGRLPSGWVTWTPSRPEHHGRSRRPFLDLSGWEEGHPC